MVARKFSIAVRLVLAVVGGYGVSAGLTALAAVALPATTALPRGEAVVLASMAAFLVYLAILIWAFTEERIVRLGIVVAAAGMASLGGALGLARLAGGT